MVVILLCFVATAAMLTVIQPPAGLEIFAWVAVVPFVVVCSPKEKLWRLLIFAYPVSLIYWLFNLSWIYPVTPLGWLAFCLYTALIWPLLAYAIRYCRIKKIPLIVAVPILFVGAERLQGFLLGGFFWRFLGHSQYQNIPLIQIADVLGAEGVSLVIALVNGLIAALIVSAQRKKHFTPRNLAAIASVALIVAGVFSYGRWRIKQAGEFVEKGPLVASLQSNVPQSVKQSHQSTELIFDNLMQKSESAAGAGAKLIIWPETMVQAILDRRVLMYCESGDTNHHLNDSLARHAKNKAYLLVGAYGGRLKLADDATISSKLATSYNSAFLYQPDGTQAQQQYDKIHLVPFGEVLPFQDSIPWLHDWLIILTPYDYDYTLDAGSEYTIFEMAETQGDAEKTCRFAALICYEDTVPDLVRRFVLDDKGNKQLDWLVNISNDGWFVNFTDGQVNPSAELLQHAAICVFRAVENRTPVIRSVNTGISCLIDSVGRMKEGYVTGNLPQKVADREGINGWFADYMPIDKRVTFFSRYGPLTGIICSVCLCCAFGMGVAEWFTKHKKKGAGKKGR